MANALVLSGAGTKGAFEVGALCYLVAEHGYVPDIITATSAGAILGTVLAQARTNAELVERVDELRRDLLAMTRTDVVFAKQPWLAEFDGDALGDAVDAFITVRNRPPVPPDPDTTTTAPPDDTTPRRHRHHRWHDLTSVLGELDAARRAKGELAGHLGSLLTLDPLEDGLRGRSDTPFTSIDPALVSRPGLQLRLAVTALGSGHTHYVTETGALVGSDATTTVASASDLGIDVIDGLLTSSSVPMIFPPRRIGDELYVDGGVRQNIPVRAAVSLGANSIVAVLGVPLDSPPVERDFSAMNLAGIHFRSAALQFAEVQLGNLAAERPDDVTLTVIEPTLDVVGPFEVAQGLMLLDMDYGWLRSAETMAPLSPSARQAAMRATDEATAARERAWYQEEALWSAGRASATDLEQLQATKRQVHGAMRRRASFDVPVPEGVDRWWLGYEHHTGDRPDDLPADPSVPDGFSAG